MRYLACIALLLSLSACGTIEEEDCPEGMICAPVETPQKQECNLLDPDVVCPEYLPRPECKEGEECQLLWKV